MARNENAPFERGAMYWDPTYVPSVQDIADTSYMEGMEYEFEDLDHSIRGANVPRTGKRCKVRIVRNVAAAALLPKRLCQFNIDPLNGKNLIGRVSGYTAAQGQRGYPVDEWLPAAGVPVNHLFYIVMEGPATIKGSLAADATSVLNIGDPLVALAAASSGASSAGRAGPQDLSGATAALGNQIANKIGYALNAGTTGNTDRDILVDVTKT